MTDKKQRVTAAFPLFTGFRSRRHGANNQSPVHYLITATLFALLTFTPASPAEEASLVATNSAVEQPHDGFAHASLAREQALTANAPKFAAKAWRQANKIWLKLLSAREKGKEAAEKELANEALRLFSIAELQAIQTSQLSEANAAINQALQNKASRYAPITLERARRLVANAEQALAENREDLAAASEIAQQATATARHAGQIAELAAAKPSIEEVVLGWESYLAELQTAAALTADPDIETSTAIETLVAKINLTRQNEAQLRKDLANSQAFNAALEEEIRDLDAQLGGASSEKRQLVMRLEEQARAREQFSQAESLFTQNEAIVFRQSNDIVVRMIGLKFASGSPNLSAGNEELLTKINTIIAIYPRSLITVEGHTDSSGSDRINKLLSEQRAQAVADYIVNDLKVSQQRVIAIGYGAERPIANNETASGREKNRRIDLLITPVNTPAF